MHLAEQREMAGLEGSMVMVEVENLDGPINGDGCVRL